MRQTLQLTFNCSKSIIIRPEKGVKYVKVNNKNSRRRHWQNKTKSIAVKYVKKYESLEETSLIWGYGLCSTLGDMSYFSYTKKIRIPKIRIPRAKSTAVQFILSKKLQIKMYSWMWKSKDKFSICNLLKSFYRKC